MSHETLLKLTHARLFPRLLLQLRRAGFKKTHNGAVGGAWRDQFCAVQGSSPFTYVKVPSEGASQHKSCST